MLEELTKKEEILRISDMAYNHVEAKLNSQAEYIKEIQKGCDYLGFSKFIPKEYIEGYEKALANMTRLLSDIKIGG